MTVLLVLLSFVTFLLIDHFHSRKQVVVEPGLQAAKREAPSRLVPSLVGGVQVPEKLRFHPGHTWALSERPILVRTGMDEFASKLTGKNRAHRAAAAWPTSTKPWSNAPPQRTVTDVLGSAPSRKVQFAE